MVSPTFTYHQVYPGSPSLHHFDLYRLRSGEDFVELGFEEFLDAPGLCCVEWAERLSVHPRAPDRVHLQLALRALPDHPDLRAIDLAMASRWPKSASEGEGMDTT